MRINETCSCGASVEVVEDWKPDALGAVDKWRAEHRHEFAPVPEPGEAASRDADHTGYFMEAGIVDVGLGFVPPHAIEDDA